MKSLLEEQKRMRELMGFTYEDNSHDVLSEEIINKQLLRTKEEYKKPIISEVDTFDWEKDLLLLEQDESLNDGVEFEDDVMDTPEFEEFMKELISKHVEGEEFTKQNIPNLKGKNILFLNDNGSASILKDFDPDKMVLPTEQTQTTGETKTITEGSIKGQTTWKFWDEKALEEYWKLFFCIGKPGKKCFFRKDGGYNWGLYLGSGSNKITIKDTGRSDFNNFLGRIFKWLARRIQDPLRLPLMTVGAAGLGVFKLLQALGKGTKNVVKYLKKLFKKWFKKRPKKYKHFVKTYINKKGKGDWKGSKFKFGVRRYVTIGKSEGGKEIFINKVGDEAAKVGIPPEQWDQYIKDNQEEIVKKMNSSSKKNWQKLLAEPDDPNDNREDGNKEYAVYVIQQYLEGAQEYKWKYVRVGDLSWLKDIEEPKKEDPGQNVVLDFAYPEKGKGKQLYKDNEWELTRNLKEVVNKIAESIAVQLENMKGVNWKDGWMAYIEEIKIESSASRFRNGGQAEDLTFAELAQKRMETAETYIRETLAKLDPSGENKTVVLDGKTRVIKEWQGTNGDGTSGPNPPGDETEYKLVKDEEEGKKLGKPYITLSQMKNSKIYNKFKKWNKGSTKFFRNGELIAGGTIDNQSLGQYNPFKFIPKGDYKMDDYADCPLSDKDDCFSNETDTPTWRGECGTPHATKKSYNQYKYTNISIKVVFNGMEEKPDEPVDDPGKVEIISGGRYPVTFASPPKGGIKIPLLGMELKLRWKPPTTGGGISVSKGKKTKGCPEAYGNKD